MENVWPKVLARHAITKTELNKTAAAFRKEGHLIFPGWETGKRVPADAWGLYAPR